MMACELSFIQLQNLLCFRLAVLTSFRNFQMSHLHHKWPLATWCEERVLGKSVPANTMTALHFFILHDFSLGLLQATMLDLTLESGCFLLQKIPPKNSSNIWRTGDANKWPQMFLWLIIMIAHYWFKYSLITCIIFLNPPNRSCFIKKIILLQLRLFYIQ